MTTNKQELLKLFRETTGKTVIEPKEEPKNPVPYQISRVQEYQMTGRRG